MIGGRCAGVRRLGAIDVGGDGLSEDVQAVQLVHGARNLGQSFAEGIVLLVLAVVGEYGVEDALEEAMTGVIRVEDADGGDGYRSGGVEGNLEDC